MHELNFDGNIWKDPKMPDFALTIMIFLLCEFTKGILYVRIPKRNQKTPL